MKKILLLTAACATLALARAQTIKNGNFENWNTVNYDLLDTWKTSDEERPGSGAITKVAGNTGFALKLTTVDEGGESQIGFFTNSQGDPIAGEGGVPYTQQPTALTGKFKCSMVTGDSALFLVVFKKQGAVIFQELYKFMGNVTTFQSFSIPITLNVAPDSVIIAAASGNVESQQTEPPVGSTITLDDILFTGTGITQQLVNNNFENWTPKTANHLIDWSTYNNAVARTTDKYKGTAAAEIKTYDDGQGNIRGAGMLLGHADPNNFSTVYVPFNKDNDTLEFWYKYTSVGGDSASITLSFKLQNTPAGSIFKYLPPVAQYTRMLIPFTGLSTHDSMSLYIGVNNQFVFHLGSTLVVDEMTLISEPLNTGLKSWGARENSFSLYPNPCSQALHIEITDRELAGRELGYSLNDITGKVVSSGIVQGSSIDISALENGVYFMKLTSGSQTLAVKKVVKE